MYLFPFPNGRIPLTKIKSMRDSLREKDLLKDYLDEHPYSQAYRFIQKQPGVTYESMRNYLDVSVVGVALHSPP